MSGPYKATASRRRGEHEAFIIEGPGYPKDTHYSRATVEQSVELLNEGWEAHEEYERSQARPSSR